MADVIQKVQFRRGTKAVLEARLVETDLGVLKQGEPAYETDTGQLKIGDGIKKYSELEYVGGGGGGEDPRFVIQDPVENQVLLYDSTAKKWVNKDLADEKSIVYLNEHGLTIKGYDTAGLGQMLVKDRNNGLAWIDPVSTELLDEKVEQARQHAVAAGRSEVNAGNSAVDAAAAATQAATINAQTVAYVEKKFWWGTLEEYNALTQIDEGTFYFIQAAK